MLKRIWLVLFVGLSFAQPAMAGESSRVPAGALRCMNVKAEAVKSERTIQAQLPAPSTSFGGSASAAR